MRRILGVVDRDLREILWPQFSPETLLQTADAKHPFLRPDYREPERRIDEVVLVDASGVGTTVETEKLTARHQKFGNRGPTSAASR